MQEDLAAAGGPPIAPLLESLRSRIPDEAAARIPRLLEALPDPVGALQRLDQFYRQMPGKPAAEDYEGRALHAALTAFSNSRYLSTMLLNAPWLLRWALQPENVDRTIPAGELRSDLGLFPADASDEQVALTLTRFKHKHILRIAMRDLLAVAPLADVALDLSTLADVAIRGAHDHIRQQLVHRFGRPLCDAESSQILCNFAVLALGKLGGSELNYSSDIDLMYIHTGDGHTTGPVQTTNKDFTDQLAQRLTGLLSMMTPEGFSYRVDLRLRPEGNAGELVLPVSSIAQYYFNRARDWELQMLLKARPVAGDLRLGWTFLDIVTPRIYRTTTDFSQIDRLAESRDRMQQRRRTRDRGRIDVKLDPGGIRDIEFLAQCLQRLHGGQDRFLRSGGTMYALHRLREKGYLDTRDYGALFNAYRYLRRVEHHLQLMDNKQTHELPADPESLERLALQMGGRPGEAPSEYLQNEIAEHSKAVSEIYDRVIRSQRLPMARASSAERLGSDPAGGSNGSRDAPVASSVWRVHLPQLRRVSPALAESFDGLSFRWGNRQMERFLDRIVALPDVLRVLEADPEAVRRVTALLEFSPHFAGYLLRFPEDIAAIAASEDGASAAPEPSPDADDRAAPVALEAVLEPGLDPDETAARMRRSYRRRMLQIQTDSVCRGEEVFATLSKSSELAEWNLRAAHALALREAEAQAGAAIPPGDAFRIIALGRLGMREFDLGSDADVAFVIPDGEASRLAVWTRAANRVIDILSSYTVDGQIFSIDPRLRPLGRDGELVQTEKQFLAYFAERAESWEALTYMKARTVAGDPGAGKEFLARLQEVLWQAFSHREDLGSLLAQMRARLETEQGESKPLKSGPGGYYDIDFILLYWRLLHAESFYESLNTPQRIDIIRSTSPSRGADLDALSRAATVLRSLDHGMRVLKGTSSQALPPTQWQRELLAGLVGRWLPEADRRTPLAKLLASESDAVRSVFRSVFEGAR